MEQELHITYKNNENIDFRKWDACINKSVNGLVYAYSWYLDSICDRWDALIDHNYRAVMPLPLIRRKGKWQLKTVSLVPQLGVFSLQPVSQKILQQFLSKIPTKYRKWELPLNILNPEIVEGLDTYTRYAHSKDLIYPAQIQETITKSEDITQRGEQMSITRGMQLAVIINFVLRICGKQIKEVEILALRRLLSFSSRFGFGSAYGVYSATNNLIGLSYVIRFHNRVYMIFTIADKTSDKEKVYQLLLNRIYKDFEKQDLVLECTTHHDEILYNLLMRNGFSAVPYSVVKKRGKFLGII